ncbi:halocarboxylic acid dehydrogenase DehI family protein [Mesobacillus harenae]|uniref:halocarboxylic acid dehydrogenase DehI family protein n=1 Tax=Mesobacillus harenae TaxID=2213203 RepID=UPI0015802BDA|nr:halocarboxylic acid dehydrogenase DehI family protein [Mesobacillus harenae]
MNQFGIPEIFEQDAQGIVKEIYEDIKLVLKVPVVNFIFRALAHYPQFLAYAWEQVRPNMLTVNMESASQLLRAPNIDTSIPKIDFSRDYGQQTLQSIKNILAVFRYVNPKLLLIASTWGESLGNRPIIPQKESFGMISPGVYEEMPSIELIHVPNAPLYLKALFYDIAKEHHSYDVASDYRALARYPRFLEIVWSYLKVYIKSDEYIILKRNLLNKSVSLVHQQMPYPVKFSSNLTKAAIPSQMAGIMGLVSYFQNFLPGLIIEMEIINKMLNG